MHNTGAPQHSRRRGRVLNVKYTVFSTGAVDQLKDRYATGTTGSGPSRQQTPTACYGAYFDQEACQVGSPGNRMTAKHDCINLLSICGYVMASIGCCLPDGDLLKFSASDTLPKSDNQSALDVYSKFGVALLLAPSVRTRPTALLDSPSSRS